jgi:superoxide dismutase, Fe-Mn family
MRLVSTGNALEFELPELPYAVDALEPHISRETLEYHYGKHHLGYVEKLNGLVSGTRLENAGLEEIVRTSTGSVFNNAAQVWNHSFFWECMSPQGGGTPGGDIGRQLRSSFGSFEAFKAQFTKNAIEKFGSGWTWLVKSRDNQLVVRSTTSLWCAAPTTPTPRCAWARRRCSRWTSGSTPTTSTIATTARPGWMRSGGW